MRGGVSLTTWRQALVVFGLLPGLALGCGKKKKPGPPPLSKDEQARAITCANAVVAAVAPRGSGTVRPSIERLAEACADACPGFAGIVSKGIGTSHAGLGGVCEPRCAAGMTVVNAPVATYWHRFALACGGERYGVRGQEMLLNLDWFVLSRAVSYLTRLVPRARGGSRAKIRAAIEGTGDLRPSLPATVEGAYAAPHSRLGVESSQAWIVVVGQQKGLIELAPWPRAHLRRAGAPFGFSQWKIERPGEPAVIMRNYRRGALVVLAASPAASLAGLGVVVGALPDAGRAYVGVALPRGVLGVHPVTLAPRRAGTLDGVTVIVIDGDALYLAGKKLPRSKRGHDWATARALIRAADVAVTLAVQLRAGATMRQLAGLLDMARGLGVSSVMVIPGGESVSTGVTEVSPAAVRVTIGPPTVTGGLHAAQVSATLKTTRPALRSCYAAELAGKPKLAGTAVARLRIEASGQTTGVRVRGVDQSVSRCAARVLRKARFPAPRGGRATVRVPISFTRGPS